MYNKFTHAIAITLAAIMMCSTVSPAYAYEQFNDGNSEIVHDYTNYYDATLKAEIEVHTPDGKISNYNESVTLETSTLEDLDPNQTISDLMKRAETAMQDKIDAVLENQKKEDMKTIPGLSDVVYKLQSIDEGAFRITGTERHYGGEKTNHYVYSADQVASKNVITAQEHLQAEGMNKRFDLNTLIQEDAVWSSDEIEVEDGHYVDTTTVGPNPEVQFTYETDDSIVKVIVEFEVLGPAIALDEFEVEAGDKVDLFELTGYTKGEGVWKAYTAEESFGRSDRDARIADTSYLLTPEEGTYYVSYDVYDSTGKFPVSIQYAVVKVTKPKTADPDTSHGTSDPGNTNQDKNEQAGKQEQTTEAKPTGKETSSTSSAAKKQTYTAIVQYYLNITFKDGSTENVSGTVTESAESANSDILETLSSKAYGRAEKKVNAIIKKHEAAGIIFGKASSSISEKVKGNTITTTWTFNTNEKEAKAAVTKITVKTPKVKSVKAGKKAFTVKWKKVKNVSGYQIRYSTKKNMSGAKKVTIKKAKTVSKKIKKLKAKKKYYVQVRAYTKAAGTGFSKTYYSKWSKKMTVKTKK